MKMDSNSSDAEVYDNTMESIVPYQCPLCKEVFLSEAQRASHIHKRHQEHVLPGGDRSGTSYTYTDCEQLVYRCHHCMETFADALSLAVHCRDEHPDNVEKGGFKCKLCPDKFLNKTYLKYHHEKYHAEPTEFKCTMCLKLCDSKMELFEHKRSCPKNLFPCDFCKLRFPSRRSAYDHIRNTHRKLDGDRDSTSAAAEQKRKKFTCLFCGKRFVRRQDMETHQRTHTGDKPFKCKVCDKGFVSNSELHHHMPTHTTVKGFRCQFCGIAYKNISTLTHHRRVKHLNPVKVPCPFPECPYIGGSEKLLKCHIRSAHIEYKSHACECGKTFSSRSHLYDHRRRKHDPNPTMSYQCSAPGCKKVFGKRFIAERHYKREHVGGTEDFKCCKCFRAFAHEETLKQHYSTHRGARFYYCPLCYAVTATEKGIVNHMAQCSEYEQRVGAGARVIAAVGKLSGKTITKQQGIKQEALDEACTKHQLPPQPQPDGADDIQYEFVVDQLQPDPKFEKISAQIEAMLMYEQGDVRREFSAADFASAEIGVAEVLGKSMV